MLRCLTVLAVSTMLASLLCGQSVEGQMEARVLAKDAVQVPEGPLEVQTKAVGFVLSSVLLSAVAGKEEAKQALLFSARTSNQSAAQPIRFNLRSESARAVWLRPTTEPVNSNGAEAAQQPTAAANGQGGFQWGAALKQSLMFLGVQHGYAMTQAKTRRELRGPFFKDYFRSVSKLGGWEDGGRFFTNYISHPMEGAITGFIQIQNDPKGIRQEIGKSRAYWTSRLKAMVWNAAYSTQFEIGPISQSSIGNVGLYTSLDGKKRKMAYVDLVVTPTLGTAWLLGEDFLDRFVLQRLELKTNKPFTRNAARVLLNPMRGAANMLRFKVPWYRDR